MKKKAAAMCLFPLLSGWALNPLPEISPPSLDTKHFPHPSFPHSANYVSAQIECLFYF